MRPVGSVYVICHAPAKWWTRGESNSRPPTATTRIYVRVRFLKLPATKGVRLWTPPPACFKFRQTFEPGCSSRTAGYCLRLSRFLSAALGRFQLCRSCVSTDFYRGHSVNLCTHLVFTIEVDTVRAQNSKNNVACPALLGLQARTGVFPNNRQHLSAQVHPPCSRKRVSRSRTAV